jgi:hypothetical protein
LGPHMRIVSACQDRTLVLLQVARENPQFEELATYIAHEWLAIAALRIALGVVEPLENEVRPD